MTVRKVYLNMVADQKRGAVVEGEKVVEWLFDEEDHQQFQSGNIFLGKVMDIVPGMEAAFVDIGAEKNGFLYRDELIEYQMNKVAGALNEDKSALPSINKLLTKGQSIIVQITKESVGTKGARLTEICSLPGKYMIYIPNGSYVAVSKKMSSESVREKWRKLGKEWLREKEGIILRTAAEKVDESVVVNELNALRGQYEEIQSEAKNAEKSPSLLYHQSSLLYRVFRDFLSDMSTELIIDTRDDYNKLNDWLGSDNHNRLTLFQGKEDLFSAYGLEKQLERSLRRHVWLKNGGFLVIDRTEALTVIDVNTGKFTGKENLQDTVVKTNLEAALTVAEQLRLRDIGGIILIDFIDMKNMEDRDKVLATLKKAVANDRTITNVGGFTKFGLVEMTRKKTRKSLESSIYTPCSFCDGTGNVPSWQTSLAALKRELIPYIYSDSEAVLVEVSPPLMDKLLENHGERLKDLEHFLQKNIHITALLAENHRQNNYVIRLEGTKQAMKELWHRRSGE